MGRVAVAVVVRAKPYACVAALLLAGCSSIAPAAPPSTPTAQPVTTDSAFPGIYNGNSFETASGIRLTPDGRFEWGLSVGNVDYRASGTWRELDAGVSIALTSTPKPVAPEFVWASSRVNDGDDARSLVRVVLPNGRTFDYASVRVECAGGQLAYGEIGPDGWSPQPGECPVPRAITVSQGNYDVTSPRFDLAQLGWSEGETITVEFRPNDLGVLDFTGAVGTLTLSGLRLDTQLGAMEFRKASPAE